MESLQKMALRLFRNYSSMLTVYFPDMKDDLKKAGMPYIVNEYMSLILFISLIIFIVQLPVLSFLFGFVFQSFLFSFIFSVTSSLAITAMVFFFILYYPKLVINSKAKDIENALPFAALYLSTVVSSKLPLDKSFEVFSRFAQYGEMSKQVNDINEDVKIFGVDINTALERAVDRSPSKNLKELLYGILSTVRAGADLTIYLKEKSKSFMAEYRRKLYEFSHSLSVYMEIYLTSIVLGAIFFTILTAIISGISSGGTQNIILVQFFLVFVFMPMISLVFIFLIKSATPGGE